MNVFGNCCVFYGLSWKSCCALEAQKCVTSPRAQEALLHDTCSHLMKLLPYGESFCKAPNSFSWRSESSLAVFQAVFSDLHDGLAFILGVGNACCSLSLYSPPQFTLFLQTSVKLQRLAQTSLLLRCGCYASCLHHGSIFLCASVIEIHAFKDLLSYSTVE